MSKALFLSLPLHGHTNPSLPLVQELVEQDEEVIYYSTPPFAPKIERTGAKYQPYRNAFLADMTSLPERIHELSWLLMQTTAELLRDEADTFRAERPDYLITDSVAPWGQWIGEQAVIGRRAEELGAGLFLAKNAVTPQTLRHSVRQLLAENSFRQQSALVGDSFRSAGGTRYAAEAIRAYAR